MTDHFYFYFFFFFPFLSAFTKSLAKMKELSFTQNDKYKCNCEIVDYDEYCVTKKIIFKLYKLDVTFYQTHKL